MGSYDARWESAVDELARMPNVVARLAAAHRPDERGQCLACTKPGVGTAHVHWPCGLYRLATEAAQRPVPTPPGGSAP